jgi:hypothetical protein
MQFILANPGAFPGWPIVAIFDDVNSAMITGGLCLAVEDGKIIGVMLVRINKLEMVFHIKQLLVRNKLALKRFIQYFTLRYSGYMITGERGGVVRQYSTRVFNLLLKER